MLEKILRAKKLEVEVLRSRLALGPMRGKNEAFDPLYFRHKVGGISIIAEVKKASPSKGLLCEQFDHLQMARRYIAGGAAAISVITDRQFFQGHTRYLQEIRAETDRPLLRKDFIIDELQLYESVLMGADMVLLIAAASDYPKLLQLCEKSRDLGLQVLLEIHDEEELGLAKDLPLKIIGINNRNLRDFTVNLNTSLLLGEKIPDSYIKVSESGIDSPGQLAKLASAGFDAVLIGESLVKAGDPAARLQELLSY